MKKLALILGLALAACSSSEDSASTDSTNAAVKRGYPDEPTVEPTPPTPPVVSEPPPVTPPVGNSCESVRSAPASGQLTVDQNFASTEWKDVDIQVEHNLAQLVRDEYKITVRFSTVANFWSYGSFNAFPMDEQHVSFTAHAEGENRPDFVGEYFGQIGSGGTEECRNGVVSIGESPFENTGSKITILKTDDITAVGTWELHHLTADGQPGDVFASGSFVAPITGHSEGASFIGFRSGHRVHPNKVTCCKLE